MGGNFCGEPLREVQPAICLKTRQEPSQFFDLVHNASRRNSQFRGAMRKKLPLVDRDDSAFKLN